MHQKIHNPYVHREGYNCFGCCPTNPIGLQMEFQLEGDEVVSYWHPSPAFQGWNHILHGGIQATLMDEIGSWFAIVTAKTSGVTSNLNVRYKKAVPTDKGAIKLVARHKETRRNLLTVEIELFSPDGSLCAEGIATYFMLNPKVAKEQFMFPGVEAFLPPAL